MQQITEATESLDRLWSKLAVRHERASPQFRSTFPDTRVGEHGWQFNTNLIEYAGRSGSFRNTTIGGAINGMELHLGVIDDPGSAFLAMYLATVDSATARPSLSLPRRLTGGRQPAAAHDRVGQPWAFLR